MCIVFFFLHNTNDDVGQLNPAYPATYFAMNMLIHYTRKFQVSCSNKIRIQIFIKLLFRSIREFKFYWKFTENNKCFFFHLHNL